LMTPTSKDHFRGGCLLKQPGPTGGHRPPVGPVLCAHPGASTRNGGPAVMEMVTLVWNWVTWLLTSKVVLLCVGGAAGTCARYFLSIWVGAPAWANGFPVGTFLINVSGSFILGAAFVIIRQRLPAAYGYWFFLVGTGFCGGYTTFSTFEFETYQLWVR